MLKTDDEHELHGKTWKLGTWHSSPEASRSMHRLEDALSLRFKKRESLAQ